MRAIPNFRFDLVIPGRGSVSFFDRVGFAYVFALFGFAIKPGPFFVINVRVRVHPHQPLPSAGTGVALVAAAVVVRVAGAGLTAAGLADGEGFGLNKPPNMGLAVDGEGGGACCFIANSKSELRQSLKAIRE